jgi:hypothetical protein
MNQFLRSVVDNRDEASLSAAFRRKRFRLFLELIAPLPRPVAILDVGGEPRFWEVMGLAGDPDYQVVLLNQARFQVTQPNLLAVVGDAADLSRFADQQFQAVFSNSVIEHLGSYDRQQRMAVEVQRVGRHYFIQTPNRFFPLEPHFLMPFFQFFPEQLQIALVRRFDLGWYPRIPDRELAARLVCSHRLLAEGEMRALFPKGRLYKEIVLGMVKSLTAYGPL